MNDDAQIILASLVGLSLLVLAVGKFMDWFNGD